MTKRRKLPQYVSVFISQTGRARYQFRRKGLRFYFTAPPGTDQFMKEYLACKAGKSPLRPDIQEPRARTFAALINSYYESAAFYALRDSTKRVYRNVLESMREKKGTKPVAYMRQRHVVEMIEEKAQFPTAANRRLKMLRLLMAHALRIEWIERDPTHAVKPIRITGGGIHTWTEAELEAYFKHHQPGSKPHLAIALMLYTGQRLGDAAPMGWQHLTKDGLIRVVQSKDRDEEPLEIPIHPELRKILDALPKDNMSFLLSERGKPYAKESLGNAVKRWCDDAGIPHCSAHGLRKLMSVRLAEAGCTSKQIAAITGHKSLSEVERYTRKANRKLLGQQAMEKVAGSKEEQKLSHEENPGDNLPDKPLKNKA